MTSVLKVHDNEPAISGAGGARIRGCELGQRCLYSLYGAHMKSKDVAAELGYSHIYFTKKIGNASYTHLEWVKALLPARVKKGASYEYKTSAVVELMQERGLL